MSTRDILDYLGNTIGSLTLDDSTTEEQWSEALALYVLAPCAPSKKDVTPRQIRQALILTGVSTTQILDAINSLPEPTKSLAMVEWEYSIAFQRNRPLVSQVGTMLGWNSQQLDDLWDLAGGL